MTATTGPPAAGGPRQASLDELGEPLREVTFVVVDLETTGGATDRSEITEIGAVKVRGGEVLGEFQTLVRPAAGIPPLVAVLTGITDAMVAGAPPIGAVLPAFLEFARGAVLVAPTTRRSTWASCARPASAAGTRGQAGRSSTR
ncbi:MAG TPA: exonuclease domain-containing protein [Frankiaceae bacterium]|nr:exonuclease domain-containing protein [Frankiaceae bacterium]